MNRRMVPATMLLCAGAWIAGTPALAQQSVQILFEARVGAAPFECGKTYANGDAKYSVADLRFYVHRLQLIKPGGGTEDLKLVQDGRWQHQDVALIDFENGSGDCVNGTAETRKVVTGTVPRGRYTGIRFLLGVPFALNHADNAAAPAPLNIDALFWNRRNGYTFARIDIVTTSVAGQRHEFPIHIGSSACTGVAPGQALKPGNAPAQSGDPRARGGMLDLSPSNCAQENLALVDLPGFDTTTDVVIADLAELLKGTNIQLNTKPLPGCMSTPDDLDCTMIMRNLGIAFRNEPGLQRFFRAGKADRPAGKKR